MRKGPPAPGEDPNFDLMVAEELRKRGGNNSNISPNNNYQPNNQPPQYYQQGQPFLQGQPTQNQDYSIPLQAPRTGQVPQHNYQLMGQPSSMGQPSMGYPPMGQPPMGQPPMGQPQMGQPPMGRPQMGQPPMGQPQMGQPAMGQPQMGLPPRQLFPQSQQPMPANNSHYPSSHLELPMNQQRNQPHAYQQQQVNVPPISFVGQQQAPPMNQSPGQLLGRGRGRQNDPSPNIEGPVGILGGKGSRDQQQPHHQFNNHGFGRGLGTLDGVGGDHGGSHQKQQAYAAALAAQVAEKEARKKAEKMGGMRASLDRLHNSPRDAMGFAINPNGGKGGNGMNPSYGKGDVGPQGYIGGMMGGKGMPPNYGGNGYIEHKNHVSHTSPQNPRDEKYERRQKELDYAADLRRQMEEVKDRKQKEKFEAAREDAKFDPGPTGVPGARVRGKALGVYSSPDKPSGVYGGGGYGNASAPIGPGGFGGAPPNGPGDYGGAPPNGPGGYSGAPPNGPGGFGGAPPNGPGVYGGAPPNGPGGYGGGPPNGPGGYGGAPPNGPGGYGGAPPNGPGGYGGAPPNGPGGYGGAPPNGPGGYGGAPPNGPGYSEPSSRARLISGVSTEDKMAARGTAIQQRRALELQIEEKKAAKAAELAKQRAEEEADRLAEERNNQALEAEKAAEKEAKRKEEQAHLDKLYRDQEEAVRLRKAGKMKEAERQRNGETPRNDMEAITPRNNHENQPVTAAKSAIKSGVKSNENGQDPNSWPGGHHSETKVAHSPRTSYENPPFPAHKQGDNQLMDQPSSGFHPSQGIPPQPTSHMMPNQHNHGSESYDRNGQFGNNPNNHGGNNGGFDDRNGQFGNNPNNHGGNNGGFDDRNGQFGNNPNNHGDNGGFDDRNGQFGNNPNSTGNNQFNGSSDFIGGPMSDRSRGVDFNSMVNEELDRQRAAQPPPSRGVTFEVTDGQYDSVYGGKGGGKGDYDNNMGRGGGKGDYDSVYGGKGDYDNNMDRGGGKGDYDSIYGGKGGGKGDYDNNMGRGGGKGDYDSVYGGKGGGKGDYDNNMGRGGGKGDYDSVYGGKGGGKGDYDNNMGRGGGKGDYDNLNGRGGFDPMERSLAAHSELLPQGKGNSSPRTPRGRFREQNNSVYDSNLNPPPGGYHNERGNNSSHPDSDPQSMNNRPYISPEAQRRLPYASFETVNRPLQSQNVESLDDFVGDWQKEHPLAGGGGNGSGGGGPRYNDFVSGTPQRSSLKSRDGGGHRVLTPGERSMGGESLLMYIGKRNGGGEEKNNDGGNGEDHEHFERNMSERLRNGEEELEAAAAALSPQLITELPSAPVVLQGDITDPFTQLVMQRRVGGDHGDALMSSLTKEVHRNHHAEDSNSNVDDIITKPMSELFNAFESNQPNPAVRLNIEPTHSGEENSVISPLRSASSTPTSMRTDGNLSVPNRAPPSFPPITNNLNHEMGDGLNHQGNGQEDHVDDEEDEEEVMVMPGPPAISKPFQVHSTAATNVGKSHIGNDGGQEYEYKHDDEEDEQPWNRSGGGGLNHSVTSNATSVSSFDGSITR